MSIIRNWLHNINFNYVYVVEILVILAIAVFIAYIFNALGLFSKK